jgi:uncharacterized membrane protein YGL010W
VQSWLLPSDRDLIITMHKVDELLGRYGESHRNPTNKAIHWICVPLITWSLLAALWVASPIVACVFVAGALMFYVWLSPPLAAGMLAVSALMLWPLLVLRGDILIIAAIVFVFAWIGQFIGHIIEGRKPSFFEDVKFLLIGPVWLLGDLYRRLGIRY